ncbi:TraB/GumN family protein [Terricaulis sp.]|uniref:TraB/GumN family protein n=1 Tax=Terricaulis sp. TaxID=2768686 RepID=UPI00378412A0
MKKLVFALIALVFAAPAAAQPQREIHPALFVVRDADSTLYIYGTVHLRRPGDPWGGPEAQRALSGAQEVWTEIDLDSTTTQETMRVVRQLGMAPPDRPLRTWLSDEDNSKLDALCARLGINRAALEQMQPWLVSITLEVAPMMQAGYDPSAGVDHQIDAIADQAGARSRAFETVEQQMRFLAELSPEVQRDMLEQTIEEAEEGPAVLDETSRAWERGDLETLERLSVADMREHYPDVYQALLVRRNHNWIPIIQHELDGVGVDFMAVGAAHLLGPDGLVALLRAQGYTVERVRSSRR